ncbi:hypothetical protein [Jiangella gansuensis]|uniref:hypothetical protein n=1 Tax=Jiangella gansuensis TaxID=281473 RepID=UPI0012F78B00|nr:hypothetical protein [Jiangella gansuensis]
MSRRASGGALAASLITAAIVGFAGGAYVGSQNGADEPGSASTPPGSTTPVGETPDAPATDGSEDPTSTGITLAAEPTSVAPSQDINLSVSTEPAEAGIELQIQRSVDGGEWENFPNVSLIVTDASGAGTSRLNSQRTGTNSFRVVRVDDGSVMSNEVQVTIG